MQYTENYDLKKPDLTDNYSVSNDNYNSDVIDTNLKELSDDIVGIPNQTYITEKAKIADVNSAIGLKADKTELNSVNSQLAHMSTQKSDVFYVDQKVAAVASGSPKNTFATLAALQADSTANTIDGKKSIYVVTVDGKWYYWNGSIWTPGGTYQSTGIADKSISLEKTLFSTVSPNLFDLTGYTNQIITTLGFVQASASYALLGYIDVLPSSEYILYRWYIINNSYMSATYNIAWYDSAKNFISRSDIAGSITEKVVVTSPTNAAYARPYILLSYLSTEHPCIFGLSSYWSSFAFANLNYEPYYVKIDQNEIKGFISKAEIEEIASSYTDLRLENPPQTKQPILTIIDDDGTSLFSRLQSILDAKGLKCSLGVITSWVAASLGLTLTQLQTLKASGYDILSHSHSHDSTVFKGADTDLSTVTDEAILAEYKQSYDYLKANGLETEAIVYPWGMFEVYKDITQKQRFTNLAKEAGYQFGVNATGGVMTSEVLDNMYHERKFIFDSNGLQYYKDLIDSCIATNGWLILGTHAGITESLTTEFLQSVINYVDASGITVKTFAEANEIKKNITSIGTFGKKSEQLYIGRNGVIKN